MAKRMREDAIGDLNRRIVIDAELLPPTQPNSSGANYTLQPSLLIQVGVDKKTRSAAVITASTEVDGKSWSENYFYHLETFLEGDIGDAERFGGYAKAVAQELAIAMPALTRAVVRDLSMPQPGEDYFVASPFFTFYYASSGNKIPSEGDRLAFRIDGKGMVGVKSYADGIHYFLPSQVEYSRKWFSLPNPNCSWCEVPRQEDRPAPAASGV